MEENWLGCSEWRYQLMKAGFLDISSSMFFFLIKEGLDTWTCRKENLSPLTLGIFNP